MNNNLINIYFWYSGGEAGLLVIKSMVEKNPKRHLMEPGNEKHLLNCPNTFGLNPVYIAALNGHLEVRYQYTLIVYIDLTIFD